MSRVGKKPIELPQGVTATVAQGEIKVKGPKGELKRKLPLLVEVSVVSAKAGASTLICKRKQENRKSRAAHGLSRALIQNMVTGVTHGFTETLEINGVGYRAETKGQVLLLTLGYSHPIEVLLPQGVKAKIDKNQIEIWSIDREQLGELSAVIRKQRPPEPYKGKGVKYMDEYIERKVGKAGAAATGGAGAG